MTAATRAFSWQSPLTESERAGVVYTEPETFLTDGDLYLDATSPRRGPVLAMEGEKVPVGGLYITRSSVQPDLWARLTSAASGKL